MNTKLTTPQLETVLSDLCHAARQLDKLGQIIVDHTSELHCSEGMDYVPREQAADLSGRLEAFGMSIQFIAQRMGWLADMAMPGGPNVVGDAAQWMLPKSFHQAAAQATTKGVRRDQ